MDQYKIGDARRHLQAESADFVREPVEPARIVFARAFLMLDVLDGWKASGDRRSGDVEWTANRVDRIDDMRRCEHPAEPQRREAVDFGERAAHHDVLRGGDEFYASLVIVAA